MRRLALAALAAAAVGVHAPAASAGTECKGLASCIRVVGPWVQVPAGPSATLFQLACPGRGQTVGGLDADRPRQAVDVTFLGALGGPVSPGVTTGREIVFVARATAARIVTFRPRLGCIPAAGGGGRSRTSYEPTRRLTALGLAPTPRAGAPRLVRRVRTIRLRGVQRQTASSSCRTGERLLAFSKAIVFRTAEPPEADRLASIRSSVRRTGRLVVVAVSGAPPSGVLVQLQIQIVCVR